MKPPVKYCAIYTRKSSEEGLEQEFNSLDAQWEACEAYILSQKAEGWSALKRHYDDGGFSGGNMERPALKTLMEDIQAGRVHIIVVYKIDRLTRSLWDFAKLVEIFDKHSVTFVSVTQSFNTTTSMGRLTLNVLLSFAQFEREVTGERIRDKVAASKKKGMWMGGMTPIGYDRIDRQLLVNREDAKTVRLVFEKYLEFGSVRRLKEYLDDSGIVTKFRISKKGCRWGGAKFSRGLLYKLLINPVYIGRIKHKQMVYDGLHEAIVPMALWGQVQDLMGEQTATARGAGKAQSIGNLLKGMLFDSAGNRYSPSFTNKGKRQYRYYVSQALLQGLSPPPGVVTRLSAYETEAAIENALEKELHAENTLKQLLGVESEEGHDLVKAILRHKDKLPMRGLITQVVTKVVIGASNVQILLSRPKLVTEIYRALDLPPGQISCDMTIAITIPIEMIKPKTGSSVVDPQNNNDGSDPFDRTPQELKNWVRGIIWRGEHFRGKTIRQISLRESCSESLVAKMIVESLAI